MFFKVSATIWRLFGALSTESLVTALDSQFTYTEPARNEPDRQNGPVVSSAMEDCNELLELAAQGGIQFVRATEDGRYEVMNHSSSIPKIFQILSYIYICIYFYIYNEIEFLVKRERFLYINDLSIILLFHHVYFNVDNFNDRIRNFPLKRVFKYGCGILEC